MVEMPIGRVEVYATVQGNTFPVRALGRGKPLDVSNLPFCSVLFNVSGTLIGAFVENARP